MRKTLALLLASSALLVACGAEEPEAAEETVDENAAEEVDQTEEHVDEPDEESDTESVGDIDYDEVDDNMYFSIYYQQGDIQIENQLEDASEIAGLHQVEFPEEYDRELPLETFIDIKKDGRATILAYELSPGVDGEDLTGEDFIFMYFDEQNQLQPVEAPIPHKVQMASGYMVEEYGEIQFRVAERADVTPLHDENGEITIAPFITQRDRFVSLGEDEEHAWLMKVSDGVPQSPLVLTLETATLTEASLEDVRLPFLVHSGGLKSVGQTDHLLSVDYIERSMEKYELGVFDDDPRQPLLRNYNELMHYLYINDNRFRPHEIELADNPSDYVGYTQDNTEINPDVVFTNGVDFRTLHPNGMILQYNSENGTWSPAPY